MSSTKKQRTALEVFIKKAEQLGAEVKVEEDNYSTEPKPMKFSMNKSAPQGGCGMGHCRCSPGLWVSGFYGKKIACAHFGSDFQRGGCGAFSVKDFHQWEKLVAIAENLKGAS